MTGRLQLAQSRGASQTISVDIPLPDGRNVVLDVYETSVMAPELAAKFPEIRTYIARGRDNRAIHGRLDFTYRGFHGMLQTPGGQVFVDPRGRASNRYYVSYYREDFQPLEPREPFTCPVGEDHRVGELPASRPGLSLAPQFGDEVRTYELAVAATGEYTAQVGGTKSAAMSAIVSTINRVNQVVLRDLSVQFTLVSDNDDVIYTNASTDPYTNSNKNMMLTENQSNLDSVIGSGNYDIGHVFGDGGGGVAYVAVFCYGFYKGQGVSGLGFAGGDPFDIDIVAHEMGHQLGAQHTFNAVEGFCGDSRDGPSAVEPGSGSTILAYPGFCGADNVLQSSADPMYSTKSIDQIIAHTVNGSGDACADTSLSGNTPPTASAPSSSTIPAETPFELTGGASDPDGGDILTYSWEQIDAGTASDADVVLNNNAIFRAFEPGSDPTRVFPRLQDLLDNTTILGEVLPDISRDLNFRLIVRDQNGGVDGADTLVTVHDTGQAFEITSQNAAGNLPKNSLVDVTWDVAGTVSSPINCANVDISLSTDGGSTFAHDLATGTPNDGMQSVTTPDVDASQGRIKVKCSDNIFFDINDAEQIVGNVNTPVKYEDVPASPVALNNDAAPCGDSPITRTISVAEDVTIADVDFGFNADHTYRGVVIVSLTSPAGTDVLTIPYDGSDSRHNYDVLLDDESTQALNDESNDPTGSPFYDRVAEPSGDLSELEGESAQGNWTIKICDVFGNYSGVYRRSALFILETDNDDDGLPDSEDPDDDNDQIPDNYENDNGLNPELDDAGDDNDNDDLNNLQEYQRGARANDPDTDDDGIGDYYDDFPDTEGNDCNNGADTSISLDVGSNVVQCAAQSSITVQSTVNIDSGGRLELISPTVIFDHNFAVPDGGELKVLPENPTPGSSP